MVQDNKYYTQKRDEVLKYIPVGNLEKVLDVGCGEGIFAESIKKKYGLEVWGVELMESEAKKAEAVLDRVLHGSIDQAYKKLPSEYFDCIVFNDVLEHMVNPYDVLDKVKNLLSHNGFIVCSIPNVRYFPNLYELIVKGDWRYKDSGVLDRTHLRFFTKKSIERMFVEHEYTKKTIVGINPIKSKKMLFFYHLVNIMTFGSFGDCKFQQYTCVMYPQK